LADKVSDFILGHGQLSVHAANQYMDSRSVF
jgi:hypothetical protein